MTSSPRTIRLGTASPAAQSTTASTLKDLARVATRASLLHVDILLLPEAYLGGYPRGSDFGCRVGERTLHGRDEFARYFASAVDLGDVVGPGGAGAGEAWVRKELAPLNDLGGKGRTKTPLDAYRGDGTREKVEAVARRTGVFLVVGCVEKAGGSLYCSVLYVCPRLGVIGKRRKIMPTGTERLIWAQGSPATLRAVSTTIRGVRVNMAAAVCWESYMPLLRQALYAQNINLYLAPTADARDTWLALMRTVGIEGRCFVVSSNMAVEDVGSEDTGSEEVKAMKDGLVGLEDGKEEAAGRGLGEGTRRRQSNLVDFASPVCAAHMETRNERRVFITEDGFEIALPATEDKAGKATESTAEGKEASTTKLSADKAAATTTTTETKPEVKAGDDAEKDAATTMSERRGSTFWQDFTGPVCEEGFVTRDRRKSWITSNGFEIALPADDGEKRDDTAVESDDGALPERTEPAGTTHDAARQKRERKWLCRGGSCIVSPFGEVLAGPQWENAYAVAYADVDFEDCVRGRLDFDAAGSYSRGDSFHFSVDGLELDPLPY